MAHKFSDLGRFWHELRRRKVFKVITLYAGTAFIILEVVNNLVGPLRLPEWTPTLVIVLLGIGFPFAIIFSWIFDITPQGLKKTESIEAIRKKKVQSVPVKRGIKAVDIIIALMAVVIAILLYPKIFKSDKFRDIKDPDGRISIAVLPFQNLTNDTIWDIWQDGIQVNLISSLSNNPEELKVRQTESITTFLHSRGLTNYASITPSVAGTVSQKLDANVFIYGSINQSGSTIRLNAQLVDSNSEDAIKSFQIDGKAENIFEIIDSLSVMVKNFLIISELKKDMPLNIKDDVYAGSSEAFRYFIYGRNAFNLYDYPTARYWLLQSISIDSNYIDAILQLSMVYKNQFLSDQLIKSFGNDVYFDQAKEWCLKAYEKRDQMSPQQKIRTDRIYADYFETPNEEIKCLKQLLNFDDQNPNIYYSLGSIYHELNQYDKAIPEYEKALEIYNKWGVKPDRVFNYTFLGESYHNTRMYKEEEKLYKKAEQDFPDDPNLILNQLVLSFAVGDTIAVNKLTEKGTSLMKSLPMSEASIASMSAFIYSKAALLDNAEQSYRRALSLEPENPVRLNDLAYFLIDKELDINEGLKLVDKALELKPDYYNYLHTKGWGLYRQGKYQEALGILQKSWDLRREKAIYDHEAFLHLEAAKKAAADNARN